MMSTKLLHAFIHLVISVIEELLFGTYAHIWTGLSKNTIDSPNYKYFKNGKF